LDDRTKSECDAKNPSVEAFMADQRVIDLIESSGLKYEIDDDGDVKMLLGWEEDERTQLVFVESTVDALGDYADVDMWSPIVDVQRFATEELRNRFVWDAISELADNKFGSITLRGPFLAVKVDVPLNISGETFAAMAWAAAAQADEMERALTEDEDAL
jgi:hypothetical protein